LPRRLARLLLPLAIAAAVISAATVSISFGTFATLNARLSDRFQPAAPLAPEVVVVGIDRRTMNDAGVFTSEIPESVTRLPIGYHAEIIRALHAVGARAIVYAYDFPPPRTERVRFVEAAARAAGNVVFPLHLASVETHGEKTVGLVEELTVGFELYEASAVDSHAVADPRSSDGVVRELPLIIDSNYRETLGQRARPTLALSLAALLVGVKPPPLVVEETGVRVGSRFIPTTGTGALRINYSEPLHGAAFDRAGESAERVARQNGTPYISAVEAIRGRLDASKVAGRIAVVGFTSAAADRVRVPSGTDTGVPDVYVHANAINTILTEAYLVPTRRGEVVAWIVAFALLAALLGFFAPLWVGPLVALAAVGGYVVLAAYRFDSGQVMDLVHPPATLILGFLATFGARYVLESRQRRRVAALFAQYVPAAVARQLISEDRAEAAAAGERLLVTVLFCDLRGFTRMASLLAPTDIRDLLNVYYRHVAGIILARRGTVMQYVGDEVFAVFGAPLPVHDHGRAAFACATELQDAVADIARELQPVGIPAIAYGIGLHSGEVVAAHVGDEVRKQYAVVGDTVNVGARLCSIAGPGEIVLSEEVRIQIDPAPKLDDAGRVELKGVDRPLAIYRVSAEQVATTAEIA
jgi:adenylate cyclase